VAGRTRLSWDKYSKYMVLRKSSALTPHLPVTRWMTERNFQALLERYKQVVVKPTNKSGGLGVMKIAKIGNHRYQLHADSRVRTFESSSELIRYLKKHAARGHIVQQYISLAKMNGRPFDLRIMVQRRQTGDWQVTGKLAKVAGKGYIVTNVARSRGSVLPVEWAVKRSSMQRSSGRSLSGHIHEVALQTARQIRKYYPWERKLGIDMGLDVNGRIWIIEVNFHPAVSLFQRLKDKSMYRKIISVMSVKKPERR
jgi:glutathione synthase/RimK-type ligase-like ATP-grasp enzyme